MKTKTDKKKNTEVAASAAFDYDALAKAIGAAVGQGIAPLAGAIKAQGDSITNLASRVDEMGGLLTMQAAGVDPDDEDEESEISAAKSEDDDDDDDDDDDMSAKKSDNEDDEEDDEDDDEEDDDDELEAELEDLEEKAPLHEPGKVGSGMKKKGSKTTTTEVGAAKVGGKPFPSLKSKGKMEASASIMAAAQAIQVANRRVAKMSKAIEDIKAAAQRNEKKLKNRINTMHTQLQAFAENESRRSTIPVDLQNLAAKNSIDLRELQANGVKMSPEQVDAMFAAAGMELEPVQRMTMKNRLLEAGLMEQGEVNRYGN